MRYTKELENALKEINRVTGVPSSLLEDGGVSNNDLIAMIQAVSNAYKEKNNRSSILKQWMTGNLSELDFLNGAKRFHIEDNMKRVVYLIEVQEDMLDLSMTVLKNLFPTQTNIWFFPLTTSKILGIYSSNDSSDSKLDKYAYEFADSLNMELMTQVSVSRSNIAYDLISLKAAYNQADTTMTIGKIFYPDQHVYNYANLGMGGIIYSVPDEICRNYISENLGPEAVTNPPVSFRDELLNTANAFLLYSLNIAETSRQLHMHRNTLLYRLEQIQNDCGLDLRRFDHAMTYKVCSLIYCYLNS
ncbi:MAG: helix-turn-helix domain-containing protein [Dorea sp.]|nr:helix-turn-helix domain-containing protein [Dorea sp.]